MAMPPQRRIARPSCPHKVTAMAKTTTTKAALKASTANVDQRVKPTGEVVRLRNASDEAEAKVLISEAKSAISDFDRSAKLEGSATQRLGHAVRGYHRYLADNGASVPKLGEVFGSTEARAKLMEHIREPFIGARPVTPKDHDSAEKMAVYNRHNTLLVRAVDFASLLVRFNVGMDQFNEKLGNWNVPARALYPAGVTPWGDMASKSVFLDGRGYAGVAEKKGGGQTFTKVQASVTQLIRANAVKRARAAQTPGSDAEVKLSEVTSETLANGVELVKLLEAVKKLFVEDSTPGHKLSGHGPKVVNLLSDIVTQYDRERDADKADAAA